MNKNVVYPQRDCSMAFRQLNVLNYIKYQGPAEYVMKQVPSTVIPSGVAQCTMFNLEYGIIGCATFWVDLVQCLNRDNIA